MVFNDFFLELKDFLFPSACTLCGEGLCGALEIESALCKDCRSQTALDFYSRCNMCGKPLISEREVCLSCRSGGVKSYERLWTLFPYTGKYRKLLTEYKFNKNTALAGFFAEKTLEVIKREALLKDAVIVPVPPRPGKIKESGWDQVECLVKRLEKKGGVSKSRCLKRRKSRVQKLLSRIDRIENLKGRIIAKRAPPKTALLIDDVITTGSTIEVCASVLKAGGAEKVYGLCLFFD